MQLHTYCDNSKQLSTTSKRKANWSTVKLRYGQRRSQEVDLIYGEGKWVLCI